MITKEKGDKNGKKGDEPEPEVKVNNIIGTAGAHPGETTTPKDSNAPNNGSSIGAHVSEVDEPDTWSANTICPRNIGYTCPRRSHLGSY